MAYLVRRSASSWEVRESVHTARGPRSRTLARFREIDDAVLASVVKAARGPVNTGKLREAARRAGVPEGDLSVDRAARVILAAAARGTYPIPGLGRRLRDATGGAAATPDARWFTATPVERGAALEDLMLLVDALPPRPHSPLRAPLSDRA